MTRRQMVPLSLGTLKNGKFVEQIDRQLDQACAELVGYMKKWKAGSKGAKAQLDIKISIVIENPDPTSEAMSVKATHKLTVPMAPAVIDSGHADVKQTGELTLLIPFTEGLKEEDQGTFPLKGDEEDSAGK